MVSKGILKVLAPSASTPTIVFVAVSLALAAFVLLYRALLPKPIPGIPHNKVSARRILGDAPDVSLLYPISIL